MEFEKAWKTILDEIGLTLTKVNPAEVARLVESLLSAKRVFVLGAGRSGLMVKTFAMRLMQMGIETYVAGEVTTPAMDRGDLLIVGSGSGETGGPVTMTRIAKHPGVTIAAITIFPQSSLGKLADFTVTVPAPTPKKKGTSELTSVQPMGSLFEQSMLMLLDTVILILMERRRVTSDQMFERHAQLE